MKESIKTKTKEKVLEIPISEKLKQDLDYINKEIICKQPNGQYTKLSRMLNNQISCMNDPASKFINYWNHVYPVNKYPEENKLIMKAINDKLTTGLTPLEDFIKMIPDKDSDKVKFLKIIKDKNAPTENDNEDSDEDE